MHPGAVLPKARDRAIDEVGAHGLQHRVIEVEALHHAGAEVLDHHIRRLDEAEK